VGIKTNLFSSKILLFISFYTLNSFRSFQIILPSILHSISLYFSGTWNIFCYRKVPF